MDDEKLKAIMAEKQITAEQLAKKTGCKLAPLKRYLNGGDQKNMTIDLPFKIAEALNIDVRLILSDSRNNF